MAGEEGQSNSGLDSITNVESDDENTIEASSNPTEALLTDAGDESAAGEF